MANRDVSFMRRNVGVKRRLSNRMEGGKSTRAGEDACGTASRRLALREERPRLAGRPRRHPCLRKWSAAVSVEDQPQRVQHVSKFQKIRGLLLFPHTLRLIPLKRNTVAVH